MKKVIRLTESDLTRIVKRVIMENTSQGKKQKMNEGIGTGLLILGGIGVVYLGRKLKKFIKKYGKYFPMGELSSFLTKIKMIEDGEENGKVVIKDYGNYKSIAIIINGKVFDSLTIDMENETIYRGHSTNPKQSDIIIPRQLPYDADTEDIEEIRQVEDELIDSILSIIVKYGEPQD